MQSRTIETWVGIFMLIGIAALAVLAFKVSGSAGSKGDVYRIEARFENVGGLNEKAPVMIGGVRVGRVAKITMDKDDYSAVVEMDIEQHYDNLPSDSGASILTAGLLGAQFVGLDPGAEDIFLEQGDELEITQSAVQLETLISQFMFSQARSSDNAGKSDSQ
jgi:phospholipid/cholesterol/gamma-HCH transport system substrate-binding protein